MFFKRCQSVVDIRVKSGFFSPYGFSLPLHLALQAGELWKNSSSNSDDNTAGYFYIPLAGRYQCSAFTNSGFMSLKSHAKNKSHYLYLDVLQSTSISAEGLTHPSTGSSQTQSWQPLLTVFLCCFVSFLETEMTFSKLTGHLAKHTYTSEQQFSLLKKYFFPLQNSDMLQSQCRQKCIDPAQFLWLILIHLFSQNNLDASAQHHRSPADAHISPKTVYLWIYFSHLEKHCPVGSMWALQISILRGFVTIGEVKLTE